MNETPSPIELMIEEHAQPHTGTFLPFAHPYYVRKRGFMAPNAANCTPHSFPAGTFAPGKVPKAYNFPFNLGTPKVITKHGVVSLGGNIPKSDVTSFCQKNGYPMPNLKVMSIPGADTTNDPGGANVENNADWQMFMQGWHYAYPNTPCDITVMIGPNTDNGIADCVTALRNLGCQVISISWGAAKSQWSPEAIAYAETEFAICEAAGIAITPASGDNSLNDSTNKRVPDYPAASRYVWPVGGTNLKVDANGNYVSETAWGDGRPGDEGGGGGFATDVPIPAFQIGVVPGSFLGIPSSALNADPASGYQVYTDGKVAIIGGTSLSAPLTASRFGIIVAEGGSLIGYQAKLYAARGTAFNDVHMGSNGDPAGVGWDDSTGNGSTTGPGFESALGIGAPPVVPPPVVPPPVVTPPPATVVGIFSPTSTLHPGTMYKITT